TSKSLSSSRAPSGKVVADQVYQATLKSIIASLVAQVPKEILKEGYQYIYTIYPQLKVRILDAFMEKAPVKSRERIWKLNSDRIQDALYPLIQTASEENPLTQLPASTIHEPAPPLRGQPSERSFEAREVEASLVEPMKEVIPIEQGRTL